MTATTPTTPSLLGLLPAAEQVVMAARVCGQGVLRQGFNPGVPLAAPTALPVALPRVDGALAPMAIDVPEKPFAEAAAGTARRVA